MNNIHDEFDWDLTIDETVKPENLKKDKPNAQEALEQLNKKFDKSEQQQNTELSEEELLKVLDELNNIIGEYTNSDMNDYNPHPSLNNINEEQPKMNNNCNISIEEPIENDIDKQLDDALRERIKKEFEQEISKDKTISGNPSVISNIIRPLMGSNDSFVHQNVFDAIDRVDVSNIRLAYKQTEKYISELCTNKHVCELFTQDEFIDLFSEDGQYFPYYKLENVIPVGYVSSEDAKLYPAYWDPANRFVVLREPIGKYYPIDIIVYKTSDEYKSLILKSQNVLAVNSDDIDETTSYGCKMLNVDIFANEEKETYEFIMKYWTTILSRIFPNTISFRANIFGTMFVEEDNVFLNIVNCCDIVKSEEGLARNEHNKLLYVGILKIKDTYEGQLFRDAYDLNGSKYEFYLNVKNDALYKGMERDDINQIDFTNKVFENFKVFFKDDKAYINY